LQTFVSTRVRKNGQCTDRTTGNIVAAVFRHDTSRAVDPHLHTHCIVFNATFDSVEARWKALQNHDMLSAQKFIENVYYHELSRRLRRFGYGVENQRRGDFEIKGVSPALRSSRNATKRLTKRRASCWNVNQRRPLATSLPSATISPIRNGHARSRASPCANYGAVGTGN